MKKMSTSHVFYIFKHRHIIPEFPKPIPEIFSVSSVIYLKIELDIIFLAEPKAFYRKVRTADDGIVDTVKVYMIYFSVEKVALFDRANVHL